MHYDGEVLVGRHVSRTLFRAERFVLVRIAYDATVCRCASTAWCCWRICRLARGRRSRVALRHRARTGEDRTDEHRIDNPWITMGAEVALIFCARGGVKWAAVL